MMEILSDPIMMAAIGAIAAVVIYSIWKFLKNRNKEKQETSVDAK